MTADPVIQSDDMLWAMNSARSSDETVKYSPVAKSVLIEVKNIFDEIFGAEAVNAHKHLLIEFTAASNPEISAGKNLIQLVAPMNCPLAIIFEFAHELCHVMADAGAPESYKWFEETLCQLMSIYMLKRIRDLGNVNPNRLLIPIHEYIDGYIPGVFNPEDIGDIKFSKYFQNKLPDLRMNDCNRAVNDTIAAHIEPLFTAYQGFWGIVPNLKLCRPDGEFINNLTEVLYAARIPAEWASSLIRMFQE